MQSKDFDQISFNQFKWLNEPATWNVIDDNLILITRKTDFWQKTWYNFSFNSGHLFGIHIQDDFSMEVCVEAEYETLYDQAGLMIYTDDQHWLKAGIEYNDQQPMISCVLTNQHSDWSTGIFTGDPRKFWLRLTKVGEVVCVKYSMDKQTWNLLRLCPFPPSKEYFVGPMACSPQREGLKVKFSDVKVRLPSKDILHNN